MMPAWILLIPWAGGRAGCRERGPLRRRRRVRPDTEWLEGRQLLSSLGRPLAVSESTAAPRDTIQERQALDHDTARLEHDYHRFVIPFHAALVHSRVTLRQAVDLNHLEKQAAKGPSRALRRQLAQQVVQGTVTA